MTLSTLLWIFGISALALTVLVVFVLKKHKSVPMTYLQNFCGVWFLFSGWVEAVDPMGTAFKMVDYFHEFEIAFEGTWFSFLAPIFPFLAESSLSFSVIMIVLEVVLGLMLIIGARLKFTSWTFLIVLIFFTILTGFTFLTGYVPSDANFFDFGSWGEYAKSNMRVTDCGCFGDFLKLEPKTSFFKDLFLMVPAIYFVWKQKDMHQLWSKRVRNILVGLCLVGTFLYCLSNFLWDIPHEDFRPFKKGVNLVEQRAIEQKAMADVQIIGWEFENENTGQIVREMNPDYTAIYKNYPKEDGWKVRDQIKTEPVLEPTKISEYEINTIDGDNITEELLADPNYSVMIVSYMLKGAGERKTRMRRDTLYALDTLYAPNSTIIDTIMKKVAAVQDREEEYTDYIWDKSFAESWTNTMLPFIKDANAEGWHVYAVTGGADEDQITDFKTDLGLDMEVYKADDLLLKTIIRSNPGIVLWKQGKIIDKWHVNKLPDFESVKATNPSK